MQQLKNSGDFAGWTSVSFVVVFFSPDLGDYRCLKALMCWYGWVVFLVFGASNFSGKNPEKCFGQICGNLRELSHWASTPLVGVASSLNEQFRRLE